MILMMTVFAVFLIALVILFLLFCGFLMYFAVKDNLKKIKRFKEFLKDAVLIKATISELKEVKYKTSDGYKLLGFSVRPDYTHVFCPVLTFETPEGHKHCWDCSEEQHNEDFLYKKNYFVDPPMRPYKKVKIWYNPKTGEKNFYYLGKKLNAFVLWIVVILFYLCLIFG